MERLMGPVFTNQSIRNTSQKILKMVIKASNVFGHTKIFLNTTRFIALRTQAILKPNK